MTEIPFYKMLDNPKDKTVEESNMRGAKEFMKRFGRGSRTIDDTVKLIIDSKLASTKEDAIKVIGILADPESVQRYYPNSLGEYIGYKTGNYAYYFRLVNTSDAQNPKLKIYRDSIPSLL